MKNHCCKFASNLSLRSARNKIVRIRSDSRFTLRWFVTDSSNFHSVETIRREIWFHRPIWIIDRKKFTKKRMIHGGGGLDEIKAKKKERSGCFDNPAIFFSPEIRRWRGGGRLKGRSSNQFGILLLGSEAKKLHKVVAPNSDRVSNSGLSVFSDRSDVIIRRMLWNHILWLLKDTGNRCRGFPTLFLNIASSITLPRVSLSPRFFRHESRTIHRPIWYTYESWRRNVVEGYVDLATLLYPR